MFFVKVFLFLAFTSACYGIEDDEYDEYALYDLVEDINANFYEVFGLSRVSFI